MIIVNHYSRSIFIGCIISLSFITSSSYALYTYPETPNKWNANNTAEEIKLLQQSLSITELDQHLARLAMQQKKATIERQQLEKKLHAQSLTCKQQQKHIDRILRTYYTGEYELISQFIMVTQQHHDLFLLLDYISLLFQTNQNILTAYRSQLQALHQLHQQHTQIETKLSALRSQLFQQRYHLMKMQRQLHTDIHASRQPQAMKKAIKNFTLYWKQVGIHEVQLYARSLAKAMEKLPDFITQSGSVRIKNNHYTITIQEDQLNQFLRQQDPIFTTCSFRFEDGYMIIEGGRAGTKICIKGYYSIEAKPKNHILFHITQLLLNHIALPTSTRTQLEQKFHFAFYPKQLIPFLEATEVVLKKKQITVKLSFRL